MISHYYDHIMALIFIIFLSIITFAEYTYTQICHELHEFSWAS